MWRIWGSSVPHVVKEDVLERLREHVEENYIGRYDVRDVVAEWKKGFAHEFTSKLSKSYSLDNSNTAFTCSKGMTLYSKPFLRAQ